MRRYACYVCVSVIALVTLGVALPLGAVQDGSFHAEMAMQVTVLSGNPWAHHEVLVQGAGHSSHVGSFTIELHGVANGNAHSQGTGAITTNSGDLLYVESETYWDADRGVRFGVFTFTGGTGRFEGASGGGTIDAGIWDGTISY